MTTFALLTTTPGAAQASSSEEHCVVRVIGQKPSGELIVTEPQCHSSFAEAMAAAGVANGTELADGATSAELAEYNANTMTTSIIGVHYDGSGFSGSSFTVEGDDCLGGFLNMSATWDNRVTSTANGCYRIRHWDGANKTGSSEDTLGAGGNLAGMNNRTSSIQYLS